jgi:anti-anti-sigma regulatory factor
MDAPIVRLTASTDVSGGRGVVSLSGRLDRHAGPVVTGAVLTVLKEGATTVAFDLSGIEATDAEGEAGFAEARSIASDAGASVEVVT